MRLCLCMLACDRDLPYLRLHLPVFIDSPALDGFQVLTHDDTSEETCYYLRSMGATVYKHTWMNNWSYSLNILLAQCEASGFDACLRLDCDECIFPSAVQQVKSALENECTLLYLDRINFWYSRKYVWTQGNWLSRAFRLNRGLHFVGRIHELIEDGELTRDADASPDRKILSLSGPLIYHYGWMRDTLVERELRYVNYRRRIEGLSDLDKLPDTGKQYGFRPEDYTAQAGYFTSDTIREFSEPQPLDPDVIGEFAP